MVLADSREALLDRGGERGIVLAHRLARVHERLAHRPGRRRVRRYGGQGVAIGPRGVARVAPRLDQHALLQQRRQVPGLQRERPFDGLHLLPSKAELVQARGEVGPQRGVVRIGVGGALEQLPRLGRLLTLHHAQAQLIQHRWMGGRELRDSREQLIGFTVTAGGPCRLGGLDHSQNGSVVRDRGVDVAQELPLWCSLRARNSSATGQRWRARWHQQARR